MGWRILCLVLFAGCAAPGPATLGDFYDQYAIESCRHDLFCGDIGASQVEACATSYRAFLAKYYIAAFGYEEAIAARRLAYAPAAAAACLDELRSAGCFPFETRSCGFVLRGLLPAGAPCTDSLECSGFCSGLTSACSGGSGTCAAYVTRGADCSRGSCDPTTDICDGTTGTCTPLLPRDAACNRSWDCQFGLSCVGSYPQVTCQPLGREGAPCSIGGRGCARGFYCDLMKTICKARVSAGGPCSANTPKVCLEGTVCALAAGAADGTCAAVLDVADDCDPSAYIDLCPSAAPCDPGARKCTPLPSEAGANCNTFHQCSSSTPPFQPQPLYCDEATLTCFPQVPNGGSCTPPPNGTADDPCYAGFCSSVTNSCLGCRD